MTAKKTTTPKKAPVTNPNAKPGEVAKNAPDGPVDATVPVKTTADGKGKLLSNAEMRKFNDAREKAHNEPATKPAAKKGDNPEELPRVAKADDPADRAAFNKGRFARQNGIRRDDAPFVGKDAKAWLEGWDYAEKTEPAKVMYKGQ